MDFYSSYNTFLVITIVGMHWVPMECALRLFPSRSDDAKPAVFSEGNTEDTSSSRTRHFWELVSSSSSSSSDIIPVQNRSSTDFSSPLPVHISLETRLQKLEHHFNTLKIYDEDCRQRLLCNLAENPKKYSPLSTALLDETSYVGDEKTLAAALLSTNQGARLLSYIEAVQKGTSRVGCDVWTYRCPLNASSMINMHSLLVWKELSKWLTVKFVANNKRP